MRLQVLRDAMAAVEGPDAIGRDLVDRVDRWGPDLVAGLAAVYDVDEVLPRVSRIMAEAAARRPSDLRDRDRQRLLRPDRLQEPDMVGYATYADRFAGTLDGVVGRIDYLASLGVTSVHLLPLLRPRPGPNDGGYAVADYRAVRPDLGTMDDVARCARALHAAGMSLTLDLVLNHVAREHDWAVRARAGDERYRAYFHMFPDRSIPDAYERTLPEVFPDFAPGNFTWDDEAGAWVWTTFNSWQWDLDWSNPDVLCEFVDIICFLANQGVDCLRLDAIAFIVKRMGTTCQNLPQVHDITQALRAALRIVAPSVTFKAEAIVGPDDLVPYLGQGQHAGKVSDLAYHNALMVHIWSALASHDGRLMAHALRRFPPVPVTATWATYVRCHDDIGWAIDDADAAAVGWSGPAHRAFLADYYAGAFPGSTARGAHFQDNPLTGDRRTSGSAASLVGLEAAVEADDADAIDRALARLTMAYAMVFGYGGIPLIWMGDEIAMLNDADYASDRDHRDDNRWLHRPAFDLSRADQAQDPTTVPGRALAAFRRLAQARASLPALHAATTTVVDVPGDPAVIVFSRRHAAGTVVEVYNVADGPRRIPLSEIAWRGIDDPRDALGLSRWWRDGADLVLDAYAALWLTHEERRDPAPTDA